MSMTEQEAINTLEAMKKQFLGEARDVLDMAIMALEKQIPKKPETYQDGYTCCPTCDNYIITLNPNRQKESNYCDKCGQKLDWSEV